MLSLLPDLLQAVPAALPTVLLQPPAPPSALLFYQFPPPSALTYLQMSCLGVPILACILQDWCSWADTSDSSLTKEKGLR